MSESSQSINVRIPLRLRFRAWWDGCDLEVRQKAPAPDPETEVAPEARPWDAARIALAQAVWGEGLLSPGDGQSLLDPLAPLDLAPEASLLDLGAGLGGLARLAAERLGAKVTGLEPAPELVEAALSGAAIEAFDPESYEAPPEAFDVALSKEFLFTVEDKGRLLKTLEAGLKAGGQLIFTDYVLAQAGQSPPEIEAWIAAEPRMPYPWAVESYTEALGGLGFETRETEDISDSVRAEITGRWAAYMARMNQGEVDAALLQALAKEAELWARRVELLDSGLLRVCRFHAVKGAGEGDSAVG